MYLRSRDYGKEKTADNTVLPLGTVSDALLKAILVCQLYRSVANGRLVVPEDSIEPKGGVEALKVLSCSAHQRSISSESLGRWVSRRSFGYAIFDGCFQEQAEDVTGGNSYDPLPTVSSWAQTK